MYSTLLCYIFRGNLNFLTDNTLLKRLTYAWLIQNGILALSVAMRNLHYIEYYGLAHRRIGVFFFLLTTIVGLVAVILKVKKRRSLHFLLKTNFISVYIVLMIMTLVNWDVVIARYNFAHADRCFVHFDFLATLSPSAQPYLEHDLPALKRIEEHNGQFPSDIEYMTAERYHTLMGQRRKTIIERYEDRHWLSWNLAYQRSYNAIKE